MPPKSLLAITSSAILTLLPLISIAQQITSSRVNVQDGVTEQQLHDAGFRKSPGLAKLLHKHKFRPIPEKEWITEVVGSASTLGRSSDLQWGSVLKWRECKGEGTYHSGALSSNGSASLTKTIAQVSRESGHRLSRTEYTKVFDQIGKPLFAFERLHHGENRTTDLSNLHKVDEIYYRLNFDGRPLGVTFAINGECLNMRASWEASIGVRKQVGDKVQDALK